MLPFLAAFAAFAAAAAFEGFFAILDFLASLFFTGAAGFFAVTAALLTSCLVLAPIGITIKMRERKKKDKINREKS